MQEDADQQLLLVDVRVLRRDRLGELHQGDHVVQEAALVGVVVLDSGRGAAELVHEDVVRQVGIDERGERLGLHAFEQGDEPLFELLHLGGLERLEVGLVDLTRIGPLHALGDRLHRALEELRHAFDVDVIAVLERLVVALARVPLPARDRPGAVRQVELQEQVPLPVGPQLLVAGQEDLVELLVVLQLGDETTGHTKGEWGRRKGEWAGASLADASCSHAGAALFRISRRRA